MKTAIVYVSTHHGNTKKLVDAIAAVYDVTLIDGTDEVSPVLSEYDCIGFASGIAFSSFYLKMISLMENSLPYGKKVFFLYTCGTKHKLYTNSVSRIARHKKCTVLGEYGCLGYDTFGPFKLVGGISKGHPNTEEIAGAVNFFESAVAHAE